LYEYARLSDEGHLEYLSVVVAVDVAAAADEVLVPETTSVRVTGAAEELLLGLVSRRGQRSGSQTIYTYIPSTE
jgi:hypothetical protein